MRAIALIVVLTILPGCVSTMTVGGYDVSGKVVGYENGEPMEGVHVSAHFSAVGPFSDGSRSLASGVTDQGGNFVFKVPRTRLWGGVGLSGHVGEWPMINFTKHGYCKSSLSFQDPTIEDYQGMLLRLREKQAGGCI